MQAHNEPITFTPAYAGQFLRDYKPESNTNSLINDLFGGTYWVMVVSGIIIPREVRFPDVSFWQGEINWDEFVKHTQAVIIRVGQAKWVDVQFERNYAEAIKRGLKVGFYFFYDDRYSPGEQAETLINALRGKRIDMEVFIDWENSYGGQFRGLPNVVAMMQTVETGLPAVRVGMYTGYYWFREHSNSITNSSQYSYLKTRPLWLAWFTENPANVLIPAPWLFLTHWQFGTPVVSWGQKTAELDMNNCSCTAQEFATKYGGNGGTMQIIKGNVLASIWIRKSPAGEHFSPARYLTAGNTIEASENQFQWLHLTKINGVSVSEEQWASAGSSEQYISWEWVDVIEPPPPTTKVHQIDVFSDGKIAVDNGNPF